MPREGFLPPPLPALTCSLSFCSLWQKFLLTNFLRASRRKQSKAKYKQQPEDAASRRRRRMERGGGRVLRALRTVLAVLVTRQNKGVDKESAPCYGLPRLDLPPCRVLSFHPCYAFSLSHSRCACCRLCCCCCCCSHLLLFLYRDKSLINIKRTPDPKQTQPSTENNINFLNFEFESDRKTCQA